MGQASDLWVAPLYDSNWYVEMPLTQNLSNQGVLFDHSLRRCPMVHTYISVLVMHKIRTISFDMMKTFNCWGAVDMSRDSLPTQTTTFQQYAVQSFKGLES